MLARPSAHDEPAIRVEEATDETSCAQVRRLLREFAAEFQPIVAEIFTIQGFEAELTGLPGRYAAPSGCLLIVSKGQLVVGCVGLRDLGGGTCELKRLYVSIPYRRNGLSRLLVAEVIRRAAVIGYQRMVLDTLPEMAEAITLYRAFGFVDADPYWNHPTQHAVFMTRPVSSNDRIITQSQNS